jgi:hypothetical protein
VHVATTLAEVGGDPLASHVVDVREHDPGAFTGEQPRRGLANAACRAGDDRALALKPPHNALLVLQQ